MPKFDLVCILGNNLWISTNELIKWTSVSELLIPSQFAFGLMKKAYLKKKKIYSRIYEFLK